MVAASGCGAGSAAACWLGRGRGDLADVELCDLDRRDLRDAGGGLADGILVVIGRDPRVDLAAVEQLESVRGRIARDDFAMLAQARKHHVRAHRGHQRVLVEPDADVQDPRAGGLRGVQRRRVRWLDRSDARALLVTGARPDQGAQALYQRLGIQRLLSVGLDRLNRLRERVQAGEHGVDRLGLEARAALAQQLEHVLHRVRELGDLRESHGRAHALQRVRDTEDLVDRRRILGVLLQPDDREVQLLEVLARLGEEHRHVLGGIHQLLR